jgi:hypothetical protein
MWRSLFVAGLLTISAAGNAHAGLINTTLTATYQFPALAAVYPLSSWSPPTFVVGAGQETDGNIEGVTHLLVNFSNASLTITLDTVLANPTWNTAAFNGPLFTSVLPLDIASASVDAVTTMAGFDASRVSFDANNIAINWDGLGYVDGTVVQVDFVLAAAAEPVSISMFGLGLVGLIAARRNRHGPKGRVAAI